MLEYSVYANSNVIGHMAVFESPAEVIIRDVSTISLTRFHLTSFFFIIAAESYYWNLFEFHTNTQKSQRGLHNKRINCSVCNLGRDPLYSEFLMVLLSPCKRM